MVDLLQLKMLDMIICRLITATYLELHLDNDIVDECFERELLLLLQLERLIDRDRRRIAADVDSIGIDRLILLGGGLLTLLESLLPKFIGNESVRMMS